MSFPCIRIVGGIQEFEAGHFVDHGNILDVAAQRKDHPHHVSRIHESQSGAICRRHIPVRHEKVRIWRNLVDRRVEAAYSGVPSPKSQIQVGVGPRFDARLIQADRVKFIDREDQSGGDKDCLDADQCDIVSFYEGCLFSRHIGISRMMWIYEVSAIMSKESEIIIIGIVRRVNKLIKTC